MLSHIWRSVKKFFKRIGWKWGTALVVVVALLFVIGLSMLRNASAGAIAANNTTKSVTLASVADLSQGGSSLSVGGTVESQSEATVQAGKSGEVTAVYHHLGDSVGAGAVVAEIENASERAAVLSAQGSVQAATAAANVSASSLSSTKDSSVAALLSAYGAVEKAIHSDTDAMFSNPDGVQPVFNVQSADSQAKTNIQNTRVLLSATLSRESARASTLSTNDDLDSELIKTEGDLKMVRDYLDMVVRALNAGIATEGVSDSTIATYKATATAARSTITTTLSTLIATRQALETAQKSAAQGSDVVSSTQAALTQAQGALAAARAALEKSIIRAPISGTINSLDLKRGDFIQAFSPVLTVANNHALEVISFITANDATRIAVGGKATLDNDTVGTITRIAPALDPLTKKIEVRIGLPSGVSSLINGQSVVVNFEKPATTGTTKPITGPITIPIAALKIGSDSMMVFTVDAESKLVPHTVELGNLLGDRVEIKSGITSDMIIVTDARGLQAGETVIVKE